MRLKKVSRASLPSSLRVPPDTFLTTTPARPSVSVAFRSGLLKIARSQISLEIDYLHLVNVKTLESLTGLLEEPARLLVAAYSNGSPRVRLIDNLVVSIPNSM